jgi:MFS superfamily sulfate permease-like transporter
VTGLFVVVVGVEQAVVLAVFLSILDYVRRGYHLARSLVVEGSHGHVQHRALESTARAEPGLVVYHFGADLFYANANCFTEDVLALAKGPGVDWICIDASAMSDVDFSGGKTLAEVHKSLRAENVRLVIADASDQVRHQLATYGLVDVLGADAIFASVGDLVEAHQTPPTSQPPPEPAGDRASPSG